MIIFGLYHKDLVNKKPSCCHSGGFEIAYLAHESLGLGYLHPVAYIIPGKSEFRQSLPKIRKSYKKDALHIRVLGCTHYFSCTTILLQGILKGHFLSPIQESQSCFCTIQSSSEDILAVNYGH